MARWHVECWHSGDTDEGHHYTVRSVSVVGALGRVWERMLSEGGDVDTITYVQCSTVEPAVSGTTVVDLDADRPAVGGRAVSG